MGLINVVIIFSYLCILIALTYKALKSKVLTDIAVIVISIIFEIVFVIGISSAKQYSSGLQLVIFIFAYFIPMLFVYIKYSTTSIKLKLVYYIANVFYILKRYENANILLKKIIKKDGKNIQYIDLAARSYKKQEKYVEARDMYFKLSEIMPDNSIVYYNLGMMFDELNKKDTALIMLATAISLDPDYTEAKEMQGIIYSEIGRYLEATNIYEELKKSGTKNYKIYYNLANIYLEKGDIESAKEEYEQAVLLNKNLYEAWYSLGNIYFSKKDYEAAIISLNKVNGEEALIAKAKYSLSKVYIAIQDFIQAVDAIEIAAKLDNSLIIKAGNDPAFDSIISEINRIKDNIIELEVSEYDPNEDIQTI